MVVQVLLSLLDGEKSLSLGVREVPGSLFGLFPVVVLSWGSLSLLLPHKSSA